MHRDVVDAVADLGVLVRDGVGTKAPVGRPPRFACVIRPENARRGDRDDDPAFLGRVEQMVCRQSPPAPEPNQMRSGGCEAPAARSMSACVGGGEQCRVFSARVKHVGSFNDGSRCQTRLNSHGCGEPSYQCAARSRLRTGTGSLPSPMSCRVVGALEHLAEHPLDCDA